MQLPPRVEQARPDGEDRGADHLRDLRGGEPFELVEDEDDPLLLREPVEHPAEGAHPLATGEVLVGQDGLGVDLAVLDRLVGEDGAALGRAPVHEDDVHGHPVEPRRELRLPAEVLQAPKDLEEDLLDHVLGIGTLAEHSKDEARDVGAMTHVDVAKRGPIARRRPREE